MSLRVAIQMDSIESVDFSADSTVALAREAQRRGHQLSYYLPETLRLGKEGLSANGQRLRLEEAANFSLGEVEPLELSAFDVVLLRQDPPFDMAYLTTTWLLEHIHPHTLVVNDPKSVRDAPEKLLMTHFPQLIPPTLITRNRADIHAFRRAEKDIIVKPLYGNGGAGIFHISPSDDNLNALLDLYFDMSREPLMIQTYLPEVRDGDKRIILADGKPCGLLNRLPPAGEARSNLHVGGTAAPTELTKRDHEICDAIGPHLKENGLIFAGIDVIGSYLTEINVTSPTGLQESARFSGHDPAIDIWDAIEARL